MSRTKNTTCYLLVFSAFFLIILFISGCSVPYNGEKLFFREGCGQCHTYKGKGGRMGPDLSAISNIKNDKWIDSYLQDPQKINPLSRMPSFKHLSRSKRKAIIAFLKS